MLFRTHVWSACLDSRGYHPVGQLTRLCYYTEWAAFIAAATQPLGWLLRQLHGGLFCR